MARVLLIDACDEFRSWARCVLKRDGLEVIEARDALAGLQRGVEDAPDLILVAHDLAGLSGLEVCGCFSKDETTCKVPLLLITDGGDPDEIRRARGVGVRGVVRRSFRSAELTRPVRETLWVETGCWIPTGCDRLSRVASDLRTLRGL